MKIPALVITCAFIAIVILACSRTEEQAPNAEGQPPKTELKTGYLLIHKTGSEMGPVTFFHRKHKKHAMSDKKCKTCHHIGKWGQSCGEAGCHDDPEKDKEGKRIHLTCNERCHKTAGTEAPTDCTDCHQEQL